MNLIYFVLCALILLHYFVYVIQRNKEGLLHVSELTHDIDISNHSEGCFGVVKDFLKVGQKINVLCTGVDPIQGSIKLSIKKLKERKNRN